jgi:uncharacterized protein YoxC
MRRVTTVLLMLLSIGWVSAQSFDVSSLDLTSAVIHQAGPTSFYIRSVGIGGDLYSLSFTADPAGGWQLSEVTTELENLLPASAILEFATITAVTQEVLAVDGVLMDGAVYQGRLRVTGEDGLALSSDITAGSVDAVNTARAKGLQAILVAAEEADATGDRTTLEEALAEQRAELEAAIAALREENEALSAENDALQDDLQAIVAERNELARDIINVAAENAGIRDQKDTLAEQVNSLQEENQRLQSEVTGLTDEVDRLTDLVTAYRSTTAADAPARVADTATPAPVTAEFPDDYVSDDDLATIAEDLRSQLSQIATRLQEIETLSEEVAALEEGLRSGIGSGIPATRGAGGDAGTLTPASRPAADAAPPDEPAVPSHGVDPNQLAELLVQINLLQESNRHLREEKERLEARILEEILSNGFVTMMAEEMDHVVLRGFRRARPDIGTWRFAGNSALQMDEDEFFAKLALPVPQGTEPTLYSFQVRSDDPGWVGVGLHLFVSDVRRRDLYGMGRSLLVWLTRDPEVRRTDNTYVELYRSDDDVNMLRVMDAMISEPLDEFLQVDVLYEPEPGYLTVAIDGQDKVRYRTWFQIDQGVEIALRALGRAEFRNLTVRTAQ